MRLFNLRPEERDFAPQKLIFCLVIYDIKSHKRRLKLAHLLETYGVRVQRSCFEVMLTNSRYQALISDLSTFYDASEQDNIVVYRGKKEDVVFFNAYEGAKAMEQLVII